MKHNWEKDENGNVNEWAWESGFHNGVFCVDCGKSVCVHCDPDYMELDDCTGPEPGIDAATALSTLQAENEKLRAELEQVKAEKDAAVESIPHECKTCVYHTVFFNGCTLDHDCTNPDGGCSNNNDRWKWRGQKKN